MTWPDHPPAGRRRAGAQLLLLSAAALLLGSGCSRGRPPGLALRPLVEGRRYTVGAAAVAEERPAGLRFPAPPSLADVEVDHERRPVVLTTGAPWSWTGRVPPRGELHAGLQLVPAAWQWVRRLQAIVVLRAGRDSEVLQVVRSAERANPAWLDLSADVGRYAGRQVTLELSATLGGLPRRLRGANLVAWGPVALTGGGEPPPEVSAAAGRGAAGRPPNIILILVDTLRRDRLTPYGYQRETSPEIGRRLAAYGTIMEDAYSQAPWTLPSVVSLFTGRYPGELLGTDLSTYGVPASIQPLAERLRRGGFETAGFLANPTMHVGAGFERGFRTFYAPPAEIEWLQRHGDDINRHALPWLSAHQDQERPFFLYLHYIDPHDPYDNPEIVGNRSPFEKMEYQGPVTGTWVHGIWIGQKSLPDPPRDILHLSALYDSEVHYVDARIGEVLANLRPEVLAHTLVVLTADHGEELFDHGGWKHGQTLYEEQIHVPLIWRWDGHIAAGRRLAGTVRLLDVAPTLAAAAGAPPDAGWQGMDLLPALTGAAPLVERPAFAQGLSSGPLRAAAVLGRQKLMVFNREEPFAPRDELQAHLWRQDVGRLARLELYDLAHDPGERHNLAAALPSSTPAVDRLQMLATVVERRLDRSLPGLRLLAAGIPAGSRIRLELTLARPPRRWLPFLLGAVDRVTLDGSRLVLELEGGDPLPRGVRIEGDFAGLRGAHDAGDGAVQALSATLDGRPLPTAQIRVGAGTPYTGGLLGAAALLSRSLPGAPRALGAAAAPEAPRPRGATAASSGAAGSRGALEAPGTAAAMAEAGGVVVELWLHDTSGEPERRAGHDAETERRLRALGYIQ